MTTYILSIHGNQENPSGNPIGYKRVLHNRMRADGVRYLAWQQFVRAKFSDATGLLRVKGDGFDHPIVLAPGQHAEVHIVVFWKDYTHGDLDKVLKGIQDSLFQNDKYVNAFSARYEMSPEKKGRVEIKIILEENYVTSQKRGREKAPKKSRRETVHTR